MRSTPKFRGRLNHKNTQKHRYLRHFLPSTMQKHTNTAMYDIFSLRPCKNTQKHSYLQHCLPSTMQKHTNTMLFTTLRPFDHAKTLQKHSYWRHFPPSTMQKHTKTLLFTTLRPFDHAKAILFTIQEPQSPYWPCKNSTIYHTGATICKSRAYIPTSTYIRTCIHKYIRIRWTASNSTLYDFTGAVRRHMRI